MPEHRHSDPANRETMDLREMRALLERLEAPCEVERELSAMDTDDTVTVAAVCEATGADAHDVIEILAELRERVAEARLADAIRDLEAPTHRVERPGHSAKTGIDSLPPLSRARLSGSLLDDVVKARKPKVKVVETKEKTSFISTFILAFFGIVILILGYIMMRAAFFMR